MPSFSSDFLIPSNLSLLRKNFGRPVVNDQVELDLKKIQIDSFNRFIEGGGLLKIFRSVFPISNQNGTAVLDLADLMLGSPVFNYNESIKRGITYSIPLRAKFKLSVFDVLDDGELILRSQKEQEVYVGDIPMMTDKGTFIINGIEKVIVSQMHRSPGVIFLGDDKLTASTGKISYTAGIIPYRGSWLDFDYDRKDFMHVRIDRKKKILLPTFLMAFGMSKQDILKEFFGTKTYKRVKKDWKTDFEKDDYAGVQLKYDLINASNGEVVIKSGTRISPRKAVLLKEEGLDEVLFTDEQLIGKFFAEDVFMDEDLVVAAGSEVTSEVLNKIDHLGIKEISLLSIQEGSSRVDLLNTINIDKNKNTEESLAEIYASLRPGEAIKDYEVSKEFFHNLFCNEDKYDLSEVGRMKMNIRLGVECDESVVTLRLEDVIRTVEILMDLKDGAGEADDIDHLGNRRIRSVGEFMENDFRIGLLRMQRSIIDKISCIDVDSVMPSDLMNCKILMSVVKDFFNISQLSQFMDQTNPLSEITHKRRLSALGPGGLTRERAGFEVRDVHSTYYGRICPIETPEGQNIGLINSLASYARINKYGFIESPFYKVNNGSVTDKIEYLSAMEDIKYNIAQPDTEVSKDSKMLADGLLYCRTEGDTALLSRDEVHYMDVSPRQLVSVAASLIPFLENDDSCRALMGTNMQRQAVPLLSPDSPLVGTGMEYFVAKGSGAVVVARNYGVVDKVDSSRIVVRTIDKDTGNCVGVDLYNLCKFRKSNHSTCINQKPIVKVGDVIEKGQVIADGPATDNSELALGRNILVAFLSWNGCNFEDSIIVSERVVNDEYFTSIHIEEFECVARDTRLGSEEITRDIPNVNEDLLYNLDESGIACIGSKIESGQVLVGKVTPKGETPMTPEEKLLCAIFNEKCNNFRDASLYASTGVTGTVIDVHVRSRRGIELDDRSMKIREDEMSALKNNYDDEVTVLESSMLSGLKQLLLGKKVKGADIVIDEEYFEQNEGKLWDVKLEDDDLNDAVMSIKTQLDSMLRDVKKEYKTNLEKLKMDDDLAQGTLKEVKVFVAIKRRLQVGDKMAGRHGNKGVVSRVLPVEDMPYLADGTSIDMILNPLGVPSRMNVGQILETHLGWACANVGNKIQELAKEEGNIEEIKRLFCEFYKGASQEEFFASASDDDIKEAVSLLKKGLPIASPVFEGPKEDEISRLLNLAGVDPSGKSELYDGRTGEKLDRKVTVGYIYIMKLHHLADDKIHARSVGPYSLVTQQPLGGKSHFGGQRFGEMECWALQAYGASYTLQEMLTVKSDDVNGRVCMYESIVKGANSSFESNLPESFYVLINELRALGLDIELQKNDEKS